MRKPLVYIASPFTHGDQEQNLLAHFEIFLELRREGVVTPIAPLTDESINRRMPQSYEYWLQYDFEIIRHCDAVLACNAVRGSYVETESRGRDMEISFSNSISVPVYFDKYKMYDDAEKGVI